VVAAATCYRRNHSLNHTDRLVLAHKILVAFDVGFCTGNLMANGLDPVLMISGSPRSGFPRLSIKRLFPGRSVSARHVGSFQFCAPQRLVGRVLHC
jgi:hypothetical protein